MLYKIQHACSGGVLHGARDVGLICHPQNWRSAKVLSFPFIKQHLY